MRYGEDKRDQLKSGLSSYSLNIEALPGVQTEVRLSTYVDQLIDSLRRVHYVQKISKMDHDHRRKDPSDPMFDPLKAAILQHREGNVDEAFWLVFLATHFGRHVVDGWRLARDIYGKYGAAGTWCWNSISVDPEGVSVWLTEVEDELQKDGVNRRFGNHRKYETLKTSSARGTGKVLESYVRWVGQNRGHELLLSEVQGDGQQDPGALFDTLYSQMGQVVSFGRTGRFDYLTMLGKIGLADIEPRIPYLAGATGPLRGARLLLDNNPTSSTSAAVLNEKIRQLGLHLEVGMQVMEDSLCNWQKSPETFIHFGG